MYGRIEEEFLKEFSKEHLERVLKEFYLQLKFLQKTSGRIFAGASGEISVEYSEGMPERTLEAKF